MLTKKEADLFKNYLVVSADFLDGNLKINDDIWLPMKKVFYGIDCLTKRDKFAKQNKETS